MVTSAGTQPDHYAALGLAPDASPKEIEEAFHARVREHLQHSNVTEAPLRQRARQVGLAYETLRDPERRRAYDESRMAEADPGLRTSEADGDRPIMFVPPSEAPPPEAGAEPQTLDLEQFPLQPEDAAPVEPEATEAAVGQPTEPEPVEPEGIERKPEEIEPEPGPAGPFIAAAAAEPVEDVEAPIEPAVREDTTEEPPTESIGDRSLVEQEPSRGVDALQAFRPENSRRSRVHAGAIGAGALVIALGIAGLLMTRSGGGEHVPTGGSGGRTAPATGNLPANPNGTLRTAAGSASPSAPTTIPVGQRSAVGNQSTVEPNPSRDAAAALSSGTGTLAAAPAGNAGGAQAGAPPPQAAESSSDTSPAAGVQDPLAPEATPQAAAAATPAAAAPAAPPPPPAPQEAARVKSFPRWLGGGIMNSDNRGGRFDGTVSVRFTVQPNGRATDCRPVASSGNPALDATTCGLVEDRLRFSPALDTRNQPVATEVRTTYTWGRTRRRR